MAPKHPAAAGPPAAPSGAVLPVAVACFFLSGVAGLLYEVVWTRLLGVVFGHTVYAITTVLATYMGGLALGAVLLGRRADRVARPLRAYGLLEAGVGLLCLATPLLFRAADLVYLRLHQALQPSALGSTLLHLGLSAALLLPPTALMGATLPLLSRAVVQTRGAAASRVGLLYAINTWGAVAGTAATGFFLVPRLGLQHTVVLGVGLNLLVAALALFFDARAPAPPAVALPEGGPQDAAPEAAGPSPAQVWVGLVALGVSGAASMAYEVAWTRALSLALGSSTYAFTAMLTTFLVGLALGAVAVSWLVRSRRPDLSWFGWVEVAVALSVVALLPAFGALPEAALVLLGRTGISHRAVLGTQFALGFGVMVLPTLLVGATFPLIVAALARGLGRLGRDVGSVYGASTLGTIAGSVAAGFVLVPALGIQRTILVAAAANLVAGVAAVLVAAPARGRRLVPLGASVAAFAALAVAAPRWDPRLMSSGVGIYAPMLLGQGAGALRDFAAGRELLFYDEGISTTVSVLRDPGGTTLCVNGKGDASNDTDMATQLLSGHLGALLHPQARRALVIGLASGVTVGAVAQHPLQAIDVAELEPAMRAASRFFAAENRGALGDPRVRVLEGDGRSILATAAQPYDLVVSEPSNPWIAGVASLFTTEFYQAARARMAPDGVFVQWLQNYSITTADLKMVVRTFQETFPHVSIWTASPNDYLLVATPGPLVLDLAAVEARAASSPGVREDLTRFHWSREELVFRFFLGEDDARRYAQGAPLNTDDLPLLEFSAPLALYGASPADNERALRSFRTAERPQVKGLDPALFTGAAGHVRAARANWLTGHEGEALHQLARAAAAGAAEPGLEAEAAWLWLALGDVDRAFVMLERLAAAQPGDLAVRRALHAARTLRQPAVARAWAARAGAGGAPSREALAELFLDEGRQRGDRELLAVALELLEAQQVATPGSYQLANNLAGVRLEIGDAEGAATALTRALQLKPDLADAQFNLGLVRERQGDRAEAARRYGEAARLAPGWARPREKLAALARAAPR